MKLCINVSNGALYVDSTYDLVKRLWENKSNVIQVFTSRYNVNILVYYETLGTYYRQLVVKNALKILLKQWKFNLI